MSHYGKTFDWAVNKLRKEAPLSVPVKVLSAKHLKDDMLSDCNDYFIDGERVYFRIRILRGLDLEAAIDGLLHEYAHALDRELRPNATIEHGESWGKLHAKCYQIVKGKH